MNCVWDGYVPVEFVWPYWAWDLDRRTARARFREWVAGVDERCGQIRRLLEANCCDLSIPDGLPTIEAWIARHVTGSVGADGVVFDPPWESVLQDVGVLVGANLLQRFPHLRWELLVGGSRRARGFQRPVIMGFRVPNPYFHRDFAQAVRANAVAVTLGEPNRGADLRRSYELAAVDGAR